MFQLKDSIENWKQKLSGSNSFTNSDIEELESHLLEEMDILKTKELTEEEAFYIASSRLGSVELLSSEFTKVNIKSIYLKRVAWLLGGYILISFIQQLITTFSIFLLNAMHTISAFDTGTFPYLSLVISIILSIIILYFLFIPKYQLLLKIQSVFNYLFTANKLFLMLIFLVFILVNSVGFNLLHAYMANDIGVSDYGKMMMSQSIFVIIWSIILCISFMLLSFKKSRN